MDRKRCLLGLALREGEDGLARCVAMKWGADEGRERKGGGLRQSQDGRSMTYI